MRDNITKVVERQERLDSLQDKTGRCFFIQFYPHERCFPYLGPLVVMVKSYRTGGCLCIP
jgi:hypothetical protein